MAFERSEIRGKSTDDMSKRKWTVNCSQFSNCQASSLFTHSHCAPQIQYRTPQSLDPPLLMAIFGQLFTVVNSWRLLRPQQASPVTMMLWSYMAPVKEERRQRLNGDATVTDDTLPPGTFSLSLVFIKADDTIKHQVQDSFPPLLIWTGAFLPQSSWWRRLFDSHLTS